MNYYKEVLQNKYAVFSGRASRREYWMFTLMNLLVSGAVAIVASLVQIKQLNGLYALAVMIPSLAVTVRRLHDTNRSARQFWWFLLPIPGVIILIVHLAQQGMPGENKYGPEPVGVLGATTRGPSETPPHDPQA